MAEASVEAKAVSGVVQAVEGAVQLRMGSGAEVAAGPSPAVLVEMLPATHEVLWAAAALEAASEHLWMALHRTEPATARVAAWVQVATQIDASR